MRKPIKTGFNLHQLIEFYIEKYGVIAYSRKYKEELPVVGVYQDIMEILDGVHQSDAEGRAIAKKYKEKIIGKTCVTHADQSYWDVGVMEAHEIRIHEWTTYSIDEKARIFAKHYVQNMIDVINEFYRQEDDTKKRQEENAKRRMDELKKQKGGRQQNDSATE